MKRFRHSNNHSYSILNNRVLFVSNDFWIAAKGYKLYKFSLSTEKWSYFASLKEGLLNYLSNNFLIRRILRLEITHLYHFRNNTWFCIAKKGIFRLNNKTMIFEKVCLIKKGSRPMNLCQDKYGDIYFGEYFYNVNGLPVSIFKSINNGNTWEVVYTFSKGEIGHIHAVQVDPYTNKIWVLTGDLDRECIIAYSDNKFKDLKIVFRGKQMYRSCNLIFYKDFIVFATDSQYEQNKIYKFDRKSLKIKDLIKIQGSGIYGGKNRNIAYISTTVEPSKINRDKNSYLWISNDGQNWHKIISFKKDIWNSRLFQFGSIRFPEYDENIQMTSLIIEGRALKGIDGKSVILKNIEK